MGTAHSDFVEKGFGKSHAWLDLANSLEWDGFGVPTDYLPHRDWLRDFLHHWRLPISLAAHPPLARLRELRAFLRHIAEALSSAVSLSPRDIAHLNRWLSVPVCRSLRQRQNGFAVEITPSRPKRADWSWAVAEIVAPLAVLLAEGQPDRVKICPNTGCRWIFFDRTKGRTRRWCNDRTCGNRERVRRSRSANR